MAIDPTIHPTIERAPDSGSFEVQRRHEAVASRASRALEAPRAGWVRGFDLDVARHQSLAQKAGALSGTANRQHLRNLCAEELHRRVSATVDQLLAEHGAMSLPPASDITQGCKDW